MGILKITAEDNEGRMLQLLFDADEIVTGTYDLSDTYAVYCYMANLETQQYEAYFISGEAQIEVNGKILSVEARLLDKHFDVYTISIPVIVPEGEDYHDYLGESASINMMTLSVPKGIKRLDNGRILIHKEGRTYDVWGR